MKAVIEKIRETIVQIGTPTGIGTGFYLKGYNFIVTNQHVVDGYGEVVISGSQFNKTMAAVFYFDPVYDLAFIKPPEGVEMPATILGDSKEAMPGDPIIAVGHPFGLSFTATQGIISKTDNDFNGVNYLQIDAAINPGNSGGPLLNLKGEIIGVNTFIIANGAGLGFALPSGLLREAIEEYKPIEGKRATRCTSCLNLISDENIEGGYCTNCGVKVNETFLRPQPYAPVGIGKMVEGILTAIGKDVNIARMGPDNWRLEEGGIKVSINHNPATKFILIDASMGRLPKSNISELYEFLLRENYKLDGISFSLVNQNVILSLQIPELYLNVKSGSRQLNYFLGKVNFYNGRIANLVLAKPVESERKA